MAPGRQIFNSAVDQTLGRFLLTLQTAPHKTTLFNGVLSGIGKAVAHHFAQDGYQSVLAAHGVAKMQALADPQHEQLLLRRKAEGQDFIVVGVVAVGTSVWLWMNGHRLKFMAYPLVVIALTQLVRVA